MKIVLSEQLVMTPQLQMAIKLLGTPTAELDAVIAPLREAIAEGDPDPDEDSWTYLDESPFSTADGDVFVHGNPPRARANGRVLPRYRGVTKEGAWLARALQQRAKTYEKIVGAIVELRPQIALAQLGEKVDAVAPRAVSDVVSMHESTIGRVVKACRIQNLHGTFGLAVGKRGITIA
jgi:DNA-directed RNA polymerase specialized sigma54-like protein